MEPVVKVLVVRTGSRAPLLTAPFALGGLELWLCPLCRAGLPHGSTSGNSRDGFDIFRAFWLDIGAAAGDGDGGVLGR